MVILLSVFHLIVLIKLSESQRQNSLFVTPLPPPVQYDVPSAYQIPQKSNRRLDIVKSLPMFYGVPKFDQFLYENSQEEELFQATDLIWAVKDALRSLAKNKGAGPDATFRATSGNGHTLIISTPWWYSWLI